MNSAKRSERTIFDMTTEDDDLTVYAAMIQEAHRRGGALCVFNSKELRGVDETDVEDEMCSAGNVLIDLRATEPADEDEE